MSDTAAYSSTALPERSYELLVKAAVDYGIYILNPQGQIISWNHGAERIKGYRAEEVLGRNFSLFFTEEDRLAGKPQKAIETAIKTGRYADEGWRLRKDGTQFWAVAVLDAVRDEDGTLIGLAKITRDMTEQRLAQNALIESERNFRLLVDSVTDYAIYMLDPGGIITNWNSGAERIKGYTAKEAIGSHFSRFYTPEDRQRGLPQKALEAALNNGRYEAEGWRMRKNNEHFWASVVIDPIRDETGKHIGFAKVTRDITERKEAEQRFSEIREQLFQSQKMESLGQLTGGIAHDFNNLLSIMLGAADLALRSAPDERLKRQLNTIISAAQRGSDLTHKLLAFARRQPLVSQVIDLNAQLAATLPLLSQSLQGEIKLLSQVPAALHKIEADPSQLEMALLNLTLNARDAINGSGVIQLSAENCTLHGEIENLTGEFVVLSVSDNGAGMPADVRERIFEPFFTTKGYGQGSGLGLSQVYGFLKQSNGAVWVNSEVGHGTTIRLYLPAMADESAPATPTACQRILVVEDDPSMATVAGDMLVAMGYEVLVVNSASEAMQHLHRVPGFHLLFTDMLMPGGINGLELANQVRQRLPELPILLTTGYSNALLNRTLSYPLIKKPYSYAELAAALERLLPAPASHVTAAEKSLG